MGTVSVDVDHGEMFANAMADEPEAVGTETEAVETAQEPSPEPQGQQPRAPNGQFAAKDQQVEPQAIAPTDPTVTQAAPLAEKGQPGWVPEWRMGEVTRERNEYRDRVAQIEAQLRQFQAAQQTQQQAQPQQPTPDLYEDPNAYFRHVAQPMLEQQARTIRGEMSLQFAQMQNPEGFAKAYQALEQRLGAGDAQLKARIGNSQNPGAELMRWHQEQELFQTTGGDLQGFLAKQQEQLLKDPAFLAKAIEAAKAQQQPGNGVNGRATPNKVNLPPSLSRLPSSSGNGDDDGDMSDAALFRHAAAR